MIRANARPGPPQGARGGHPESASKGTMAGSQRGKQDKAVGETTPAGGMVSRGRTGGRQVYFRAGSLICRAGGWTQGGS